LPRYHNLYFHWSPFCFVLEPHDESGADPNGQDNGQVRLPYGKHPSRVGHFHPPLSRPHSVGGFTPSWKRYASYHNDPPAVESSSTRCCRKTLASSESCKNATCLTTYPTFHSTSTQQRVLYHVVQEYSIPEPTSKDGGLIEHQPQLIPLIVGHLDINVSRGGWGSSDQRCFNLLRYHGL